MKKAARHCLKVSCWLLAAWLLLPLVVFDFSSTAFHHDQEKTDDGHEIAIGPLPRGWISFFTAYDFDFPGGYGYSEQDLPFVVWKPLCVIWCQHHGFSLPASWR